MKKMLGIATAVLFLCLFATGDKAYAAETIIFDPTIETPVVDTPDEIDAEIYEGELQMLAILVMAEAGNQDLKGKRLVVDVVLNRVDDPRWPSTISGVIFDPYQFSPIKDGGYERASYTVTDECFEAVRLELVERLDNSIHYFCGGGYGYGEAAYKYGDHYFSR